MGYYVRQRHELLLIATKGSPPVPNEQARPDSVIEAPRTTHSRKPECVYEMLERAYSYTRKLEMFARTTRDGWNAFGNQLST